MTYIPINNDRNDTICLTNLRNATPIQKGYHEYENQHYITKRIHRLSGCFSNVKHHYRNRSFFIKYWKCSTTKCTSTSNANIYLSQFKPITNPPILDRKKLLSKSQNYYLHTSNKLTSLRSFQLIQIH